MPIYWVWYAELSGISASQKIALLAHFRDPEEIYHASRQTLAHIPGMTDKTLDALDDKDLTPAQTILANCAEKGVGILPLGAEEYPSRLRNTYDPPLVLYFKGALPAWEQMPVIGVVGTRKATPYGMNTAKRFGSQIAACGALVVSGGATGIDTAAMEGALDAGGLSVGVLGCGVDVVYPAANKKLFAQVTENGCLLSEYPPKIGPAPWRFPERNRIISGIANGLLVVEAPEKSGALITANRALEQGRDVFAVPGNIDVDACVGSNALLQDGAVAALSGWDVVKEYECLYPGKVRHQELPRSIRESSAQVAQKPAIPENAEDRNGKNDKKSIDKDEKSTYSVLDRPVPALTETEQALLARIGREAVAVDALIAQTELPAGTVRTLLTKLALKGLVLNHPGGRVSRK